MECRFEEKAASSNQRLKAEGKTGRYIAFSLMPSSACWRCLHMCLEPGKKNCNHSKKRKMDQVLVPEEMVVLNQHWVHSIAQQSLWILGAFVSWDHSFVKWKPGSGGTWDVRFHGGFRSLRSGIYIIWTLIAKYIFSDSIGLSGSFCVFSRIFCLVFRKYLR